jgi:hypothetical protein
LRKSVIYATPARPGHSGGNARMSTNLKNDFIRENSCSCGKQNIYLIHSQRGVATTGAFYNIILVLFMPRLPDQAIQAGIHE